MGISGVSVPVTPGGARVGGVSPKGYALLAEPGDYGIYGAPSGLALSDSVTVTLTRGERPFHVDPSMLRWFLTPQGAALAAWLSLVYLLLSDR